MDEMKKFRAKEAFAGEKTDRYCGDCRFCRNGAEDHLRCMRHKIETNFAALCYAWERRIVTED